MSDLTSIEPALRKRANQQCELCESADDLRAVGVDADASDADQAALACGVCAAQIADEAPLDANHWYCLQGSIWSEVAPVQVLSYRLATRLKDHTWAADLLEQAYLEPERLAWAQAGIVDDNADDAVPKTLDCNGAQLVDGDAVTVIKDLKVKGTSFVAKQGTMVKNIRLTSNPEHVDGRVNGVAIVLKTCFVKKA